MEASVLGRRDYRSCVEIPRQPGLFEPRRTASRTGMAANASGVDGGKAQALSILHKGTKPQIDAVQSIEEHDGVEFQSRQSYYDLFAAAKITRKKAQRTNPKHDADAVATKKKRSKRET